MEERVCVVQLEHPGAEHRPDTHGLGWNRRPYHRRRFMVARGRYLADDRIRRGRLTFRGEWEARARLVHRFEEYEPALPRFLYEPVLPHRLGFRGWQNTDPFVFGGLPLYTGCLQHTVRGPTQLRYLAPGSVILFGSHLEGRLSLDTVFVVASPLDHSIDDHMALLEGRVPDAYLDVTIRPWYANLRHLDRSHRLYFGATARRPFEGMFGFVPCLPADGAPGPFPRPAIELPGIVEPRLRQGKKISRLLSADDAREVWREVGGQVLWRGLRLGTLVDLPSRLENEPTDPGPSPPDVAAS